MSIIQYLYYADWLDRFSTTVNTYLVKNGRYPYKPFLYGEMQDHPVVKDIKANFEEVRSELLAASQSSQPIQGDLFFDEQVTEDGLWHRVYLKWYSKPFKSALKSCPKTVGIIERHKDVRLAMVSILKPHAVIKPHYGPWAGSYRCLLGIQTPNSPKCAITVAGHEAWWTDGEAMFFDDTFQHSVVNDTEDYRIVLFMDIERPMRSKFHDAVRWFLNRTVTKITARSA